MPSPAQPDVALAVADMPDDDFRAMLASYANMTTEQADIGVVLHHQAWKRGDADLVTNTVEELTGRKAMTIDAWLAQNLDAFR